MKLKFLTTDNDQFLETLTKHINESKRIYWAVAYISSTGFNRLSDIISTYVESGRELNILIDIEAGVSEYMGILEFATLPQNCNCKLFYRPIEKRFNRYHPKLYIFENDNGEYSIIIGSSNMTLHGLVLNYEANILISGRKDEGIISESIKFFNRLWENRYSRPVAECEEILEDYRKKTEENIYKKVEEFRGIPFQLDPDFAYLLGLTCGKGEINNKENAIILNFNYGRYKNGIIKGANIDFGQDEVLEKGVLQVKALVDNFFLGHGIKTRVEYHKINEINYVIKIIFSRDSKFFIEFKNIYNGNTNYKEFIIPKFIIENDNVEVRRKFMMGYADISGLITATARTGTIGRYRIYLKAYRPNRNILVDLCILLQKHLNVPVEHIHWRQKGDPREYQLRIYPEAFYRVGFNIFWKKKLLVDFARENRERYPSQKCKKCVPTSNKSRRYVRECLKLGCKQ